MAFEIVDGMTGTKHISSDDLSALNTATIGKADCVLEYGDDFKLTMASANSATLGTGVGMVGGKRFWNQAATSLTIQSGTQGQKRNDLVVARYQKTSAGIESITPVVIKGTPTTGTAADPATTANDLKLWRVPLDGINAGTPVRLFEPVTPLATLGESVSQTKTFLFASPCMKTRGNSAAPVVLKVCGNACTLYVNGMTTRNIENYAELLDSASLKVLKDYIPTEFDSEQQRNIIGETKPVGCRLAGSGPNLWLSKDSTLSQDSEMRFVFSWVR